MYEPRAIIFAGMGKSSTVFREMEREQIKGFAAKEGSISN